MPRIVWVNLNATRNPGESIVAFRSRAQYITALQNDPNVPSGFTQTSGSDEAEDEGLQQFQTGYHSGGFPTIAIPDANDSQPTVNPKAPNGILGGSIGQYP